MISIGSCKLGAHPCLAVAIDDREKRSHLDDAMTAGAHMIELRIDRFSKRSTDHVLSELKKYRGIPRIATVRGHEEGGAWNETEETRQSLYEALLHETEAIDIELNSTTINEAVIAQAAAKNVVVIASYHDFEKTPSPSYCGALIQRGVELGADIVKIAVQCESQKDLLKLTQVLVEHADQPLVIIGMGEKGIQSRFLFPALGSLITYTFLGQATAPGQLTFEETITLLRSLYP